MAIRQEADAEYARAEAHGDPVSTTVWGRGSEQIRKLALLYAIGKCHQSPRIGQAATEWAARFVMHQTRRKLFMARAYVADSDALYTGWHRVETVMANHAAGGKSKSRKCECLWMNFEPTEGRQS